MISKHRRSTWLGTLSIAAIAGIAMAPLAHADSDDTAPGSTIAHEYEVELDRDDVDVYDDVDVHDDDNEDHDDDNDHDDDDHHVQDDDDDDDDESSTTSSTTPKSTTSTSTPESTTSTTTPESTTSTAPPTTMAPTTTAAGGDLPATGGDALPIALLAGVGLAGGTAITAVTRRRRAS